VAPDYLRSKFVKISRENREILKKVRYGKHILGKVDNIKPVYTGDSY